MFDSSHTELVRAIDAVHIEVGCAQRRLLGLIADVDRREAWRDDGARDTAHWLGMRYGISGWKAHRWIAAAHALDGLPRLSEAFGRGELGIDKVVELCRFATAETEVGLIRWARDVSCGAIRHRGDLAVRATVEELVDVERSRSVSWWYFDQGRRFGLELELPAAAGQSVVQAIEREAESIPAMPGEPEAVSVSARRADAFVALCSARIAADADPDRATVVVHAPIDAVAGAANAEAEGGSVIPPQTLRRLLCNARVQTVLEDGAGNALGLGRMTREPSAWMIRQVRYRDRGCRFPGCGTLAFTEAHHVRWWRHGGRTDLDNLALICSFHHRLVHEHGWSVRRHGDGTLHWFTRDGTRYRAGPGRPALSDPEPRVAGEVQTEPFREDRQPLLV
ncbi:MAG: DUF222 domain-containing protein [Actinomycetota bacterium]